MIEVIYAKNGTPISDFEAENFVKEYSLKQDKNIKVVISNEIVLNFFRVYVKEGKIDKNNIVFMIDGVKTYIDKDGHMQRYPKEDFLDISLRRLLDW